jgi:hypothetical protein
MPPRDQALWILAGGLIFFTIVVIGVAAFMSGNQAIYTLFSGILGNFSGGLMVYLRLQQPPGPPPAGGAPA